MVSQQSSVDLFHIVSEMQSVVNGRIDQIYQLAKQTFLIRTYNQTIGKKQIIIHLPNHIFFSQTKPDANEQSSFLTYMRKHLKGLIIEKIEQMSFNRIINIKLTGKETTFNLIIELYDKGNIIVTDKDFNILVPFQVQKWSSRTIKKHEVYEPEHVPFPHELSLAQLNEMLTNEPLAKQLATKLRLGGKYATQLCEQANIDPLSSKVNDQIIKKLKSSLTQLFEFKEVSSKYDGEITPTLEKKIKENPKIIKQKKIIDSQQKTLKTLNKNIEEYTKIGEYIYGNYAQFEELLARINKLLKTKSASEVKVLLKKENIQIDLKNKEIQVEIND